MGLKRKSYDAAFKARVVLEVINGESWTIVNNEFYKTICIMLQRSKI